MQTFLPSANATIAASMLDSKRLNKQILECYQILNVLSGKSKGGGWRNHPAVLMWKGYEKGTENNEANLNNLKDLCWDIWGDNPPSFWNDKTKLMRVVTTHKASLFDKDPMFYARFGYAKHSIYNSPCCSKCKYYWVTHEGRNA
jgi:hypothetical protein